MKLWFKLLLTAPALVLLMSGCAQKIKIKALDPAEVGEMAYKKKVAVSSFTKDRNGLSGKIESKIASFKLDKKKYFTVISRKDINKIVAEQKLQSSELMDEETATRVGKLVGAQAMINGEIASSSATSGSRTERRQKCVRYVKKKGCVQYRYYNVTCKTMQANVSANLNIVDIETGTIIYGDTLSKDYNGDSCRGRVLSRGQAINNLTSAIASDFVYKLTPHYITFTVKLLEDIKVKANSKQKLKFKSALAFIKAGRLKKAEKFLTSVLDELNGESLVVAYDLAVVKEALGKLDKAKELYTMADSLANEPVEELDKAILRIDKSIAKRVEAKQQIDAK